MSGTIFPARPGEAVTMQITSAPKFQHKALVTDSQGRFELIHRPTRGAAYEVFSEAGSTRFVPSDTVLARVRPKIFLSVGSVRRSSRHMTVRFTMRMVADPKAFLSAALQRHVTGTSWTPKMRIQLDGLRATFTATFPRKTQRVRVVGSGSDYEKGTSGVVVVRP